MATPTPDFESYIKEKWKISACPRCGENSWSVGTDEELVANIPLSRVGTENMILGGRHLPLYWLACTVCAHIEWVAAKPVDEWMKART